MPFGNRCVTLLQRPFGYVRCVESHRPDDTLGEMQLQQTQILAVGLKRR